MKGSFPIILLSSFFLFFQGSEEQTDKIHLSYNVIPSSVPIKKFLDKSGCANFYIGNEHFKASKTTVSLNDDEIENAELITLDKFIELSNKKRRNLIRDEQKERVTKILSNSEIFKIIYLYEKKGRELFRYRVEWVDEIAD